ncbi:MAG: hypothetical protein IT305_28500 [Chloroflexi bacterium]|nr:hypothetical protein [Chloroflexota bacterium]
MCDDWSGEPRSASAARRARRAACDGDCAPVTSVRIDRAAAVIQRLVRERPDVVGIGVAGMPACSTGMESPVPVAYDVLAWRRSGPLFVCATVAANGTIRP